MAHHQTYAHDDWILQALLRMTLGAELDSSDPNASAPPLELEPQDDATDATDANRWDVLVRSRPPRA